MITAPWDCPVVLRLGAEPLAKPLSTSERLAIAERDMEAAIKRWSEAYTAWTTERAQSQPISAARKPVGDGMVRF